MESKAYLVCCLFFLLILKNLNLCSSAKTLNIKCLAAERDALLKFKQDLTDPSQRLSSWTGTDCCNWTGIGCDARTSRVITVDLKNPYQLTGDPESYEKSCLGGKINPSLLLLPQLSYLDLSRNNFKGITIPEFFGDFGNLRHLNLSFASFSGKIPKNLGKLSKLQSLDLYAESLADTGEFQLFDDDLQWLSGLSSLSFLNLGYVNLSGVGDVWLESFSKVQSLTELHLFKCELQHLPSSLTSIGFKSLSVLDLSENSFNSLIPKWLFNLTSLTKLYLRWDFLTGSIPSGFANLKLLQVLDLSTNLDLGGEIPPDLGQLKQLTYLDLSASNLNGHIQGFLDSFSSSKAEELVFLDLSSNNLEGKLPQSLGALKKLQVLDLSSNSFTGSIPSSISSMSSLRKLDLSDNRMDGTLPESFGQLGELVDLNLLGNSWAGILQKAQFVNLKRLETFRLTTEPNRSLVLDLPSDWIPPFRLKYIQLENCRVGPVFPMWLQVQTELITVTLKNVGISDIIPEKWFTAISSHITYLVLSNNGIKGKLPRVLATPNLNTVDLSSNRFEGSFPLWSTNATDVQLQENLFSGPIPQNLDKLMPRLQKLYLFSNNFNGEIPQSMCGITGLQVFSIRSNHFSGEIPNCWGRSQMLWGIDASNNSLTGKIPASFGLLRSLSVLLLSDNKLEGQIPDSLQNCTGLTSINLQRNNITGSLPSWLGNLSSLFMLRLKSNFLTGQILEQLCSLQNLRILELSDNRFSGSIPICIGDLKPLVLGTDGEVFQNLVYVVTRGKDPEYSSVKASVNSIDLSGNNLTGQIPKEILRLAFLRALDLSRNSLTGSIPDRIGDLKRLEALELSHNKLSGRIPESLASLASLSRLNLSYNNLAGKIPSLPKFTDPSIYQGNPKLCGAPLPTKCP